MPSMYGLLLAATAILPAVTGVGYGVVVLADSRYAQITQLEAFAQNINSAQRLRAISRLQYAIDELEFIAEFERSLTARESWQLKRLRTDTKALRGGH